MLTDKQIRAAKPGDKPYKMADEKGLYVQIATSGSKLWRMKYTLRGKEKLLSFGPFPEVGLAEARQRRDAARALLRDGRDPSLEKKIQKAAAVAENETFESVAREWHALNQAKWTDRHADDVISSLEGNVFSALGALPLADITAAMVLSVLRQIEQRPAVETARRVRQRISAVFMYGIGKGLCAADPAAVVKPSLAPLVRSKQPAITDLPQARQVLVDAEAIPAHPVTRIGLRFLALTAARPSELRGAMWSEFQELDGPEPLWVIPKERMKMKRDHLVPLSTQAVEALQAIGPLTGRGKMVFPNARHPAKPMSENALGYLLNRAGYHHTHVPHGWRATFSTVMNERYPADRSIIDLMLAHVPGNKTEAAYNRAQHMKRRRELAQIWADLILADAEPSASLLDWTCNGFVPVI